MYLYLYKLSGGVVLPPETNTGLVFLNARDGGLFLETSSRFEGDSDEQQIVEPAVHDGTDETRRPAQPMTGTVESEANGETTAGAQPADRAGRPRPRRCRVPPT